MGQGKESGLGRKREMQVRERGKVFTRGGKRGVLLRRKQEKAEREMERIIPLLKVPRPTTVISVTGWGLAVASNTDHVHSADSQRATSTDDVERRVKTRGWA